MSFDINKIHAARQALSAQLARGGNSTSAKFWQIQNGKNTIRIMPCWETDENSPHYGVFWRSVHQHWRVNDEHKAPIVCPAKTKYVEKPCPICDFVEQLKKAQDDPTAQELANEIRAKQAFLLQIIDLSHPTYTQGDVAEFKKSFPDKDPSFEVGDPKLQVYSCPQSVMDGILTMVSNTKKDITHLTKGYDIVVDRQYNKAKPMLTKYQVSAASFDASEAPISPAEWEQKKIDLGNIGRIYEADKMHELLSTGVGMDFSIPALTSGPKSKAVAAFAAKPVVTDDEDDLDLPEVHDTDVNDLQAAMKAALANKKAK